MPTPFYSVRTLNKELQVNKSFGGGLLHLKKFPETRQDQGNYGNYKKYLLTKKIFLV